MVFMKKNKTSAYVNSEILNPSRKIKVLSVEDAYKLIQTQIKQSKLTNEGD